MRHLCLHLGMPKSGSTFLQTALRTNHEALKRAGVYCPVKLRRKGAKHGALFAAGQIEADAERLDREAAARGCDKILLSNEWWVQRLIEPGEGEAFAAALRARFELRVALVLRRVDLFWESLYAQALKRGLSQPFPLGEAIEAFDWPLFHYAAVHEALLRTGAAVSVAPLARDRSDPLATTRRVLGAMGCLPSDLQPPVSETANERWPRRLTLFLRDYDRTGVVSIDAVLRALEKSGIFADDGVRELASPEARRAFWEARRAPTERLCAALGDETLAAELLDWRDGAADAWRPAAPVTEDERAAALALADKVNQHRRYPKVVRQMREMLVGPPY